MGFVCAPQILGLVRGEPKPNAKHRANGRAIFAEFGEERITSSETFDKTRSHLNQYEFVDNLSSSGFQCWDYIEERANQYKVKAQNKKKEPVERALPHNAVVGFAVIIKPPEDVCISWSDDEYEKFYKDTWEYLGQKEPRIFRDENVVLSGEHHDEGFKVSSVAIPRHKHIGGEARDKDGKVCGNLIDAKLLSDINVEYPAFMRSRGWDMDDLDCTDWDRYKTDRKYREERKEKAKQNGLSVNKYRKKKSAEQRKAEEEALTTQAEAFAQERDELELARREQEEDLDSERADVWLEHKQNVRDREKNARDREKLEADQQQFEARVSAEVERRLDRRERAEQVSSSVQTTKPSRRLPELGF